MGIANIHVMRKSLNAMYGVCRSDGDNHFLAGIDQSAWLEHLSQVLAFHVGRRRGGNFRRKRPRWTDQVLKGAVAVSESIQCRESVLVHCSDG